MVYPTLAEFESLAEKYNVIPVWRDLQADLETPVSVYLKLRNASPSFLLESVEKGEQLGRYSFLGIDPAGVLTLSDGRTQIEGALSDSSTTGGPLAIARQVLGAARLAPMTGLACFYGGLVGYVGYEATRFFERVPQAPGRGLGLPDAQFMLADTVLVFDHVTHRLQVIVDAQINGNAASAYHTAVNRIDAIVDRLASAVPVEPNESAISPCENEEWHSNFEQEQFEAAVRSAKGYITAGDIFQVVLSQRLSRRTAAAPFDIYRALRTVNPSPYMFYLQLPNDVSLIGSSPEMLVRLDGQHAQVRPIAGTRPRGASPEEDARLAEELLADPKECAEHVMLVDLGRNDLGRVCNYGTVNVPEMMAVERYSHVMHIVSRVLGELKPDHDAFDLLQATFPAGTVSGAPKVRAMEIIAELERQRRGPYAGAVGYFGYSGNMDTCIAIRTIVMQGDVAHVQAGAGIVADSEPAREYQETLHKARALAQAVSVAERSGSTGWNARS
ncbi:MAG: anthranilate synthase component I [Anaerolineales bacterium]|nr:anthranilate synthase component I [Anaerolineales bacterium]